MRWSTPVSVVLHVAAVALLATQIASRPMPLPVPPLEVTLVPPAVAAPAPPPLPPPPEPPAEPVKLPPPPPPDPVPEPEPVKLPEPPPPERPRDPPPVRLAKPKVRQPEVRPAPPVPDVRLSEPVVERPPPPPPPPQVAVVQMSPRPVRRSFGPPPNYLSLISAQLERNKFYPPMAQRRRQHGEALLRFTVARDGRVLAWTLDRSTGHALLDRAVEEMIRRASPMPPMPADMDGDRFELTVPVPFTLR